MQSQIDEAQEIIAQEQIASRQIIDANEENQLKISTEVLAREFLNDSWIHGFKFALSTWETKKNNYKEIYDRANIEHSEENIFLLLLSGLFTLFERESPEQQYLIMKVFSKLFGYGFKKNLELAIADFLRAIDNKQIGKFFIECNEKFEIDASTEFLLIRGLEYVKQCVPIPRAKILQAIDNYNAANMIEMELSIIKLDKIAKLIAAVDRLLRHHNLDSFEEIKIADHNLANIIASYYTDILIFYKDLISKTHIIQNGIEELKHKTPQDTDIQSLAKELEEITLKLPKNICNKIKELSIESLKNFEKNIRSIAIYCSKEFLILSINEPYLEKLIKDLSFKVEEKLSKINQQELLKDYTTEVKKPTAKKAQPAVKTSRETYQSKKTTIENKQTAKINGVQKVLPEVKIAKESDAVRAAASQNKSIAKSAQQLQNASNAWQETKEVANTKEDKTKEEEVTQAIQQAEQALKKGTQTTQAQKPKEATQAFQTTALENQNAAQERKIIPEEKTSAAQVNQPAAQNNHQSHNFSNQHEMLLKQNALLYAQLQETIKEKEQAFARADRTDNRFFRLSNTYINESLNVINTTLKNLQCTIKLLSEGEIIHGKQIALIFEMVNSANKRYERLTQQVNNQQIVIKPAKLNEFATKINKIERLQMSLRQCTPTLSNLNPLVKITQQMKIPTIHTHNPYKLQ